MKLDPIDMLPAESLAIPSSAVHAAPHPVRRILALDGLRGVAALMVLFHHILLTLPDFANAEWRVPGATTHGIVEWLLIRTPLELIWSGQARALLFFILSGFVLGLLSLGPRTTSYGRFLLGRFCRIYPPYIIAMAGAALGSAVLGGHPLVHATIFFNELGWAFHPSWAAAPSIAAVISNPDSRYMNEAIWTLVWEVRVVFIFPLLMMPIIRWRNRGIVSVLGVLLVLKPLATHFISPSLSATLNAPQDTFYYAQFFIFGAAVAANRSAIVAWFSRNTRVYGPLGLALGCLICWLPWPIQDERMVGVGATVVLAAVIGSMQIQSWLTKSPLLWLGRQSYSLYLTHLPLIMVVVIVLHGRVSVLVCGALIPAAIFLGWAFHRWVETPAVACAQYLTGYSKGNGGRDFAHGPLSRVEAIAHK